MCPRQYVKIFICYIYDGQNQTVRDILRLTQTQKKKYKLKFHKAVVLDLSCICILYTSDIPKLEHVEIDYHCCSHSYTCNHIRQDQKMEIKAQ